MTNTYYIENGFPVIRITCKGSELLNEIDILINYNDGQGRNFDILDEEL